MPVPHGVTVTANKVIFATGAHTQGGWPTLDQTFRIMRVMVVSSPT